MRREDYYYSAFALAGTPADCSSGTVAGIAVLLEHAKFLTRECRVLITDRCVAGFLGSDISEENRQRELPRAKICAILLYRCR